MQAHLTLLAKNPNHNPPQIDINAHHFHAGKGLAFRKNWTHRRLADFRDLSEDLPTPANIRDAGHDDLREDFGRRFLNDVRGDGERLQPKNILGDDDLKRIPLNRSPTLDG